MNNKAQSSEPTLLALNRDSLQEYFEQRRRWLIAELRVTEKLLGRQSSLVEKKQQQ